MSKKKTKEQIKQETLPITVKEFRRGKVYWWRNTKIIDGGSRFPGIIPRYSRLRQFYRWLRCKIGGYGRYPLTNDEWEMWFRTKAQRTLDRMKGRW